MPIFLIDENLSPQLASWLRRFKYDALAVRDAELKGKDDQEIIRWLQEHKRTLITSDLDFGEFFYGESLGSFGVIILRSRFQNESSFKRILLHLHHEGILKDERINNSLLVATPASYRWRRFEAK